MSVVFELEMVDLRIVGHGYKDEATRKSRDQINIE